MKYPEAGVLYLETSAGLCNRMLACTAGLDLSKKLGKRLVLLWKLDGMCGCAFEALFEPIPGVGRVINLAYRPFWKRWRTKRFLRPGYLREPWVLRADALFQLAPGVNLAEKLAPFPWLYLEAYNNFTSAPFTPGNFRPVGFLQSLIERQTQAFSGRIVGVHVRRTDNIRAQNASPDEAFAACMDEELARQPSTRFFLATDSPESEAFFRARFPGKIIAYAKRSLIRKQEMAIQDALVDLYCLARTEKILGSFYSTFSTVAASLSGIPLEIVQS